MAEQWDNDEDLSNFRSALEPVRPQGREEVDGEFKPIPVGIAIQRVVDVCGAAFKVGESCDSPIEQMLGGEIIVEFERRGNPLKVCTTLEANNLPDELLLIPQYRWGIYRSDWAILRPGQHTRALLIECDGRDFHSSAAQQAHDEKKDAAALERGHLTVRFSGREINRSAQLCAQAVYMLVLGGAA